MKKYLQSEIISTGLAIFSMFFGAGNLMFPLAVGLMAGEKNIYALSGFLLTAVGLPLIGLIGIILFDGDYDSYFGRVGKIPGFIITLCCMLIIGPLVAMPRIVTLSHIMISPFLGNMNLPLFSVIFLTLTFFATYKESKIVDLLGWVISPALLVSLFIIIGKGLYNASMPTEATLTTGKLVWESVKMGYNTLDVLGAIFFSAIVLTILKKNLTKKDDASMHQLIITSLKAGVLGTFLLALVYIGMSYLGVYYGHNLAGSNGGELFSLISFKILGPHAAIIVAIAVLMACFSTIIALAAVVTEFMQCEIMHDKVEYVPTLIGVLGVTFFTSYFGLTKILELSTPIIEIGYPVLVVITILNIAYKLFDFKPIKTPVLITLIISCLNYLR